MTNAATQTSETRARHAVIAPLSVSESAPHPTHGRPARGAVCAYGARIPVLVVLNNAGKPCSEPDIGSDPLCSVDADASGGPSIGIGRTHSALLESPTGCLIMYPSTGRRVALRSDETNAMLRNWRMLSMDARGGGNRMLWWGDASALADASRVRLPRIVADAHGMPTLDAELLRVNANATMLECDVHEDAVSALADAAAHSYASVSLWPGEQRLSPDGAAQPRSVPSAVTIYMVEHFSLFDRRAPVSDVGGNMSFIPDVRLLGDVAPSCAYGDGILA